METSNHGDNNYLTWRHELLSSVHCSKDLKVEYNGVSPTTVTWECTENPTEVLRKHRSRFPRARRSRSSPVRSRLSGSSSLERRARSPSVSATRLVLTDPQVLPAPAVLSPHDTLYAHPNTPGLAPSAMAYFSTGPPCMPLYIVPLPPNPSATVAQIEKILHAQNPSKPKIRDKTGRKIVRHLLRSILKKIPTNTENVGVEAVDLEIAVTMKKPDDSPRGNRSIATQSLSKYGNSRKMITDEDECSSSGSSDGCEWAGSVRALRDSHVRLVLRQLRHLRDIERLNRALRRERAHE